MRVSDLARQEMAERLRRAHEEGLIDLSEFDERVGVVWGARTRDELRSVTADLPKPRRQRNHGIVFADSAGGVAMKVLTTIWACVVAVALTSWGIMTLTGLTDDPWWLWVAGPPGVVLLVLYVAGAGRPPRRG
ncbi:uncharacterized protein DUF1707 [Pseudonocardia endophytica]|uniref:Uncharacterized protein DUF1707 n=2 Tax=Pseudonocardia endophytica TaxID=401976 RepID=A0A4R1HWM5_PSEEN|nr:uncharacterized protein DUF1707 [Pseudonocardia endophytica]